MNKLYILIALTILAVGVYFSKNKLESNFELQNTSGENVAANSPTPSESPSKDYSGWKEYNDSENGFGFMVPKDFEIEKSGKYSVIANLKSAEDKVGNPRFFYVSAITENYDESDQEVIYNFNLPDYRKINDLKTGESLSLSDINELKSWFTYERLEDASVDGEIAKVFVNKKPWEFPEGTEEYRYYFQLTDKVILAGAYVDGPQTNGFFPKSLFEEIINTLEIK